VSRNSNHFIYEQIAGDIRQRIQCGEFTGERLPPERTLAALYNANRLTLRKAIDILVEEKLLYRDSTRGTFIGRRPAGSSENKIIGFLLVGRSFIDQIHSITIMELEKQLKIRNSNTMLFVATEESEVEQVLTAAIAKRLVDRLIVAGLVTQRITEMVKSFQLPTVLFGHLAYVAPVEQELDRVYPDSIQYGYEAVKAMIAAGKRRIALLNGPGYQWFMNIDQGYQRALDEEHIKYDETLVCRCDNDTPDRAVAAMAKLVVHHPDAIFAANERLMRGVLDYLSEHRHDWNGNPTLITVGTYQSDLIGRRDLRIVACDWAEMTRLCLEMIYSRFDNPSLPPRFLTVPFKIV